MSASKDSQRVVVVTGAGGRGCGRAIAARFGRAGAAVVVSDIDEAGGRAAFFRADVRRDGEMRELRPRHAA